MKIAHRLTDAVAFARENFCRAVGQFQDRTPAKEREEERRRCRGRYKFRSLRSVWMLGENPEVFIAADEVVRLFKNVACESCFVMLSDNARTEAWLKVRFLNDRALPAPFSHPLYLSRFEEQLAPKLVVILQSARRVSPLLLRRAAESALPVVLIGGRPHPRETVDGWAERVTHPAFSHLCVEEEAFAEVLQRHGIPRERISVTGSLAYETALASTPAGVDYLKRELRLPPDPPVVLCEAIHRLEERAMLETIAALRREEPRSVLLWKPATRRQLERVTRLAAARDLPIRRWNEPHNGNPALLFLDPNLAATPFYPAATGIILGRSFTTAPSWEPTPELITLQTPLLHGPHLPASLEPIARAGGTLPTSLANLPVRLLSLIRGDANGAALLEKARKVMEPSRGAAERTVAALAPFYPALPDENAERASWRPAPLAKNAEAGKKRQEIEKIDLTTWEAFRERIGAHRSILCLGNGPTSELPELAQVEHDLLFRVNCRWKDRGLLTEPNVVFVGNSETIRVLTGPIVFILNRVQGRLRVFENSQPFLRTTPLEYFVPDAENCPWFAKDEADELQARPSNGALMIATAAALQPEAITIAGIDLFSHPDGRYPGDLQGANTYSHCHNPSMELLVIERALLNYRGRLHILSPILREALLERGFPAQRLVTSVGNLPEAQEGY